ncbi:MAG: N-acetylmuramoyl-L-alanine amidase family protein [Stackebrandtia sp.]
MSEKIITRRHALLAAAAGLAVTPFAAGQALADPSAAAPRLYIDPGHGGSDSGAVGNGLREKDITLDIALQVRDILQANHTVDIRMSRTTDITRSLSYRSSDANSWGANFFVSIHINSAGGTAGTGFESYRYTNASSGTISKQNILHPRILSGMRTVASVADRGKKSANFHVLRETSMSAILTENLFINNPADANLLKRADFRTAAARGHAQGIVEILGL